MATRTVFEKLKGFSGKIVWVGLSILMGVCSFWGMFEFSHGVSSNTIFIFVLTLLFWSFVTLIHEIGHAVAAWLCKCRVHFIAVGNFGFDPENRKFRKHSVENIDKLGGFIQYSPSWPVRSRWPEIIVSLAGPLVTLILGLWLLYRFLLLGYDHSNPSANTGYMWLGFACVLSTVMNLLPFKLNGEIKTDGRNIWDSCWASKWTLERWMETRAYVSFDYRQEMATDEEWLLLRRNALTSTGNTASIQNSFQNFAWAKTDPKAFMAVIDNGAGHIAWLSKTTQYKYVSSAVLTGAYKPSLGKLIPETPESDSEDINCILWHFATVLKAYAAGNPAEKRAAVSAARMAYIAAFGAVGAEEEAIFCAVEKGAALPALKWPALIAENKNSSSSDIERSVLALA